MLSKLEKFQIVTVKESTVRMDFNSLAQTLILLGDLA